jgi:nucleoside-diphosphate-sugar epimerase
MCKDDSDSHRTYFVSNPKSIDTKIMFEVLGKIFNKKVLIVPLPKQILYIAMIASTFASKIVNFTNQLDMKQYLQITAPAFVCSSKALQDDLDWTPKIGLEESLRTAAKKYEEDGLL